MTAAEQPGALLLQRDVVVAAGPDAAAFLQGQLSQDVDALAPGDAAFSLLLQPQGKVDAFLRVTRTAFDEFALDVDAGWGAAVAGRLRRFLLRVDVRVDEVRWPVVTVRAVDAGVPEGAWRVPPEVPGDAYDLVGPGARLPEGVPALDAAGYEALRIARGVPRMGRELDESTIPAAAGIVSRTVSFTKGCYTGQELVARVDARGSRTPTRLRLVRGEVPAGAVLRVEDREVGQVTSAAGGAGLAYVRRDVEPPAAAVAAWHDGTAEVVVEALP